jgi:hypothetical protein
MHRLPPVIPAVCLVLSLQASAAPQRPAPATQSPDIEHLWPSSWDSGLESPLRAVAQDPAAFRALWAQARSRYVSDTVPPPPVDFGRFMVIVAAMGAQPSTGYRIRIEAFDTTGDAAQVRLSMLAPADCLEGAMETYPLDVARVPRTRKPVTFVEDLRLYSCKDRNGR